MKNIRFLILFFYTLPALGHWEEINSTTNNDLIKIEIIDENAFCGGKNGILLKSIDFGNSWTEIATSASGSRTDIHFLNTSVGYFTTSNGKIFKTINEGTIWTEQSVHNGSINGIDFKDDSTGIAVGDFGNIFKTEDGGENWINLGSQSIYILNDVSFLNDTLIVAVGATGSYLFSTNSGENWTYKNTNQPETFFTIEKKDSEIGSIVGTNGSYAEFSEHNLSIGDISIIDNDGNWLKDVHFTHKENSYIKTIVVGFKSTVYIENNGWNNWSMDSLNNLNSVHFFNDTIGLACGSNGKIYKTTSGGVPSSIKQIKKIKLNTYPNPVNTTLFFEGNFIDYEATIYNTLGQLILKKVLTENQLDLSHIPKGNYYVKLHSSTNFTIGVFSKK